MTVRSETRSIHEVIAGAPRRGGVARLWDRVREPIHSLGAEKSTVVEKLGDWFLLVPDMVVLLWRLANDSRVSGRNKGLLVSAIAYFISPWDAIPEAVVGPIGYVDDLVLSVYVLNKLLSETDPAILREHWSGRDDVLESVRNVLSTIDALAAEDVVGKLRKITK